MPDATDFYISKRGEWLLKNHFYIYFPQIKSLDSLVSLATLDIAPNNSQQSLPDLRGSPFKLRQK
jgi:hypothetical protein